MTATTQSFRAHLSQICTNLQDHGLVRPLVSDRQQQTFFSVTHNVSRYSLVAKKQQRLLLRIRSCRGRAPLRLAQAVNTNARDYSGFSSSTIDTPLAHTLRLHAGLFSAVKRLDGQLQICHDASGLLFQSGSSQPSSLNTCSSHWPLAPSNSAPCSLL